MRHARKTERNALFGLYANARIETRCRFDDLKTPCEWERGTYRTHRPIVISERVVENECAGGCVTPLAWPLLRTDSFLLLVRCLFGAVPSGKKSRLPNRIERRSESWWLCSAVLSGRERSRRLASGSALWMAKSAVDHLRDYLKSASSGVEQ